MEKNLSIAGKYSIGVFGKNLIGIYIWESYPNTVTTQRYGIASMT